MSAEAPPVAGHLRGGLREFSLGSQLTFRAPALSEIWRVGEELERRCASVQSSLLQADVIAASHRALLNARKAKDPLSNLGVRELRWAPFALFYPASSPSGWLANDKRLVDLYFRWIEKGKNKRALARLLRAFVLNYEPELSTFELLRGGIQKLLATFDSPRIVERRTWAKEHHVLEPAAPRAFARDWLRDPSTLVERLSRLGRDGELAVSLFVRAVERVVCEDVAAIGAQLTQDQFRAAVNGLSIKTEGGVPRFRDPLSGGSLSNTVLLAFATSRPSERLRMEIRQALVDRFGDPRLASNSAAWSGAGVSQRALQVFKRWLVDDTLRVFFEVISEASRNSPEKRAQWEARRLFWTKYLDQITDAWVALSPSAHRITRDNPAFRDIPHGNIESANDNSVLIMAIDDLHLVEFSHVGGVRYWAAKRVSSADSVEAPELFKEEYRMLDFSVPVGFNIPHHDGWQAKVRKVIRDETGVRGDR